MNRDDFFYAEADKFMLSHFCVGMSCFYYGSVLSNSIVKDCPINIRSPINP